MRIAYYRTFLIQGREVCVDIHSADNHRRPSNDQVAAVGVVVVPRDPLPGQGHVTPVAPHYLPAWVVPRDGQLV